VMGYLILTRIACLFNRQLCEPSARRQCSGPGNPRSARFSKNARCLSWSYSLHPEDCQSTAFLKASVAKSPLGLRLNGREHRLFVQPRRFMA
jgi:hypothetical protein